MEKSKVIAVALGVLVLISVVQAIQIVGLKSKVVGNIVGNVVGDSKGGETYEDMMARMHPDQAQAAKKSSSSPSGGARMVGGC